MSSPGRGIRFAPSPTGHFHIGNLRTAWISQRLARELVEPLVVRIEDLDTLRNRPDARSSQASDLSELGVVADAIVTQSMFANRHAELFEKARRDGKVYPCDCSRRDVLQQLVALRSAPHGREPEYSGHCRNRNDEINQFHPKETLAWRWKSSDASGTHDAIVARTSPDGSTFTAGYHWACAVDDADGDYRLLVRAWDLESADEIQREIRKWVLSGADPIVFHTTLVTQDDGHRLEKRTGGVTLRELHERGISTATLLRHFDSSFALEAALKMVRERTRPAGESARAVSLSRLLD